MNNYHIHVIDARHMSDEEINQYSGDLKAFFIMLKEKYDEEMLEGVVAKHRETWYALSTIKKDKRYREYIETVKEEQLTGGVRMCETLDFIEQRGMERGIERGIEQGRSLGEDLLGKLMEYLLAHHLTEEAKIAAVDKAARQEMYKKYGIIEE